MKFAQTNQFFFQTVEEMYNLADDIIGPLKYIKDTTKEKVEG